MLFWYRLNYKAGTASNHNNPNKLSMDKNKIANALYVSIPDFLPQILFQVVGNLVYITFS
jgi:hypothetical protein